MKDKWRIYMIPQHFLFLILRNKHDSEVQVIKVNNFCANHNPFDNDVW